MINLDEILSGASDVGIAAHVRPDGDAFGSSMGLYLFLKKYYPQIRSKVFLEDSFSDSFRFIKGTGEIISDYPQEDGFDVFFALDISSKERLGKAMPYFEQARTKVLIDHHVSNTGFGQINEIQPEASSTSELIALLIGKDRLTKEIAEPLYLGIIQDTGVFQYSCTSSRTMMVSGWLMDTGIAFSKICDDTFYKKTYHQNQIMGRAITESIMMLGGKVIFSAIPQKAMRFYEVEPKDLDGIVQQLRVTEGVEVAIFLYQTGLQEYKVSLRSNGKVDVCQIASYFQGGGHKLAAGCTMQGEVHDVINNIVKKIDEQLKAFHD